LIETKLLNRIHEHARAWRVDIEDILETETSLIAFGSRDHQPVVLKVVKRPGDEWHSGEILQAFAGHGFVRVYEHAPGAVLLERLRPGNSLVEVSLNGQDEEATDVLADVIQRMTSIESSIAAAGPSLPANESTSFKHCPKLYDWAKGFDRYAASGERQVPQHLFESGRRLYLELYASQRRPRLLHGDLQHYNVLFDSDRGWLAIDPKGVIGEVEYEIGAAVRNPRERLELFLSSGAIERRLKRFTSRLNLNYDRVLAWAFAQAVLSAIWEIEDGFVVDATNPALRLAEIIRPMLGF
jgi:streptomycin 6-kinase